MQERDYAEYVIDLKKILKGKVVILCVGNIERGDDGVGPCIANAIKGRITCEVIDAGIAPENYTGVIKRLRPDTIVVIDAIRFEGKPGEVRLFSSDDLRAGEISTHDVSPKVLTEYLKFFTNAEIYILGINPKSNRYGETLSKEVKEAVTIVQDLLLT